MIQKAVSHIMSLGFKVYMRKPSEDRHFIFTDGINMAMISYIPAAGYHLTSMHRPNMVTGTGFAFGTYADLPSMTKEELSRAFYRTPSWATSDYYSKTVRKWKNIDEFLGADPWNGSFRLVEHQDISA